MRKIVKHYFLTATVWQMGKAIAVAENLTGFGAMSGHLYACGYERGKHAEVRAAILARGKLSRKHAWGVSVQRYKRDGSRGCSKPCPLCQAYLAGAGCGWVDYFDSVGKVSRLHLT